MSCLMKGLSVLDEGEGAGSTAAPFLLLQLRSTCGDIYYNNLNNTFE